MPAVIVLPGIEFPQGIEQLSQGFETIRRGIGDGQILRLDSPAREDSQPPDPWNRGAGPRGYASVFPPPQRSGFGPATDGIDELAFE